MGWTGKFNGAKGYKAWKLNTSRCIAGYPSAARYTKDGLLSLIYRRKCQEADKRIITEGLREILGFKGKHLTLVSFDAGSVTIEFYCFLDEIPTEGVMNRVETFLHIGDLI